MANYGYHTKAGLTPLQTIADTNKVSIICDVQYDKMTEDYDILIVGVRIENEVGKHLYIPHDFIEDILQVELSELVNFVRPKHREERLEMIEPEYDRSEDLSERMG